MAAACRSADYLDELRALVAPAEAVFVGAKIESELTEDEARELLASIGRPEPGLHLPTARGR
jgi:hypothetical protein